VEGTYFGAGPWFTVQQSGQDWEVLDNITLSDSKSQIPVRVEIRMTLENAE
jgi:hypothetical protein